MAKTLSLVFGLVFLIVGLLGFVGNPIVGNGAMFHTDLLHNVVHLVFGALLLWGGTAGAASAPMLLKVAGVVYLLLGLLGLLMGGEMLLGLVAVNAADHWLHLALGVVLFWAGWANKEPGMGGGMM